MTYTPGEQVVHVTDEDFDILTVIRDCGEHVECFEYNPNDIFIFEKDEVEPL